MQQAPQRAFAKPRPEFDKFVSSLGVLLAAVLLAGALVVTAVLLIVLCGEVGCTGAGRKGNRQQERMRETRAMPACVLYVQANATCSMLRSSRSSMHFTHFACTTPHLVQA